jgi:hypothetical protein
MVTTAPQWSRLGFEGFSPSIIEEVERRQVVVRRGGEEARLTTGGRQAANEARGVELWRLEKGRRQRPDGSRRGGGGGGRRAGWLAG